MHKEQRNQSGIAGKLGQARPDVPRHDDDADKATRKKLQPEYRNAVHGVHLPVRVFAAHLQQSLVQTTASFSRRIAMICTWLNPDFLIPPPLSPLSRAPIISGGFSGTHITTRQR